MHRDGAAGQQRALAAQRGADQAGAGGGLQADRVVAAEPGRPERAPVRCGRCRSPGPRRCRRRGRNRARRSRTPPAGSSAAAVAMTPRREQADERGEVRVAARVRPPRRPAPPGGRRRAARCRGRRAGGAPSASASPAGRSAGVSGAVGKSSVSVPSSCAVRREDAAAGGEAHRAARRSGRVQDVGGGEGRVPAEVDLGGRGEPAQRPVGLAARRQRVGEGGLREVDLGGDLLEPVRRRGRRPESRSTTPAGLPAKGRSVNASTMRIFMEPTVGGVRGPRPSRQGSTVEGSRGLRAPGPSACP